MNGKRTWGALSFDEKSVKMLVKNFWIKRFSELRSSFGAVGAHSAQKGTFFQGVFFKQLPLLNAGQRIKPTTRLNETFLNIVTLKRGFRPKAP